MVVVSTFFWLKSKTNEKQTNQRREKKRQIENNIYYLLVPLEVLFNLIIFAKVFSP
jgi:C4-dicarboxylate transporter